MKSWEIHLSDWSRIVFGNVPPVFFVEVIFRVVFTFILLIFSMRLMGKRLSGQLDRSEITAMSALAAAIGIPIQAPDRGLLPALAAALIVVVVQRMLAARSSTNERFETKLQGHIDTLVIDGVLQPEIMNKTRVSRDRIFSQLRSMEITHLGSVSRLYFEASGNFSLVEAAAPAPGLTILPEVDPGFRADLNYMTDQSVCTYCGKHAPEKNAVRCNNCGHEEFAYPCNPCQTIKK